MNSTRPSPKYPGEGAKTEGRTMADKDGDALTEVPGEGLSGGSEASVNRRRRT